MANITLKNKKTGRTVTLTRKPKVKIQIMRKPKIKAFPTDPRRMA